MLLILLVCAAPVVASYLTYFVIRPEGRTNYSDLIDPPVPIPSTLPLADLQGRSVAPTTLRGQWLLVVVAAAACDGRCERHLWLQRQLHESLGREKARVDKLWLMDDAGAPRPEVLAGIGATGQRSAFAPATVLRTPRAELAAWLRPLPGKTLDHHLYLVDPSGAWMLRAPVDLDPAKLKRDLDKLLRASSSWDQPGR
jgi:cytochrome oxidase Cu insertion factor (SCO1/SenC/PrrC family)